MATMNAVVEEEVPMAIKMKAMTRAVAEEDVPKKAVLSQTWAVERRHWRRLIYLDPGKSLNCPPATSRTAGALQAAPTRAGPKKWNHFTGDG